MDDNNNEQSIDQSEIASLSDDEALLHIGLMIDQALDKKAPDLTTRAFELLEEFEQRELSSTHSVLAHYFRANAWENRLHEAGKKQSWDWDSEELQNQILELRRAIRHEGFNDLEAIRRCQVYTNLGNKLNSVGRFVEAIEQWDKAITLEENFAMALANRACGLSAYANSLYDSGHYAVLKVAASDGFGLASAAYAIYDAPENASYKEQFVVAQKDVIEGIDAETVRASLNDNHSLGRSKAERAYRTWVLQNRLFLNPLNDLGTINIASHDVFTLPSITLSLSEYDSAMPPPVIGFFNQLKQEYVSARFLCFEGLDNYRAHYSDKGVLLYNTLDYPSYSLAAEKMRLAFRSAYSLFDKIAFFLNDYFKVGYPPNRVNFRNIWFEHKGSDPKPMRALFVNRKNWPLRGLYWLSKDLFDETFKKVTEPDAHALAEIRNHLEHKYMQLHEGWGVAAEGIEHNTGGVVHHLSRDEFETKTLRVLKLARAALIYLSLAVHREEYERHHKKPDEITGPMLLDTWRDNWKT